MRDGFHFFYLPDQDHGADLSLFVSFFGQMKVTLPHKLPKLVKLAGASVIPMFSAYNPQSGCYELIFRPAMEPLSNCGSGGRYPRRLNEEIEIMLDPQTRAVYVVPQILPDSSSRGFDQGV